MSKKQNIPCKGLDKIPNFTRSALVFLLGNRDYVCGSGINELWAQKYLEIQGG